jgi:hypothetical protein
MKQECISTHINITKIECTLKCSYYNLGLDLIHKRLLKSEYTKDSRNIQHDNT